MVPIFVEHWGGGDNLQFYPNFTLFSTLEGMNLDHDFVQVWKFSEDQKKNANKTLFLSEFRWRPKKKSSSKIEHFFSPILGEDQKKKVFSKNRTLFPQIYAQLYTNLNYLGDADVDHSQTIGGDTTKVLRGIYPPILLRFRHPW